MYSINAETISGPEEVSQILNIMLDQVTRLDSSIQGLDGILRNFANAVHRTSLSQPTDGLLNLYNYVGSLLSGVDYSISNLTTITDGIHNVAGGLGGFSTIQNITDYMNIHEQLDGLILRAQDLAQFFRIIETQLYARGVIPGRRPAFDLETIILAD